MRTIKYSKKYKKFNKTKKKSISTIYPRGAILPHAGKTYAGDARKKLLRYFPRGKIRYIIYISAIHNSTDIPEGVYQMHKDKNFLETPKLQDLPKLKTEEHSFKWVEEELRNYFPGVQIFVLTPVKTYTSNIVNWITNFIRKHNNSVLFSTTDLIHHGENYNNNILSEPYRLSKQNMEENFIHTLVKFPLHLPQIKYHTKNKNLLCGPYAVQLFTECISLLKLPGKVIDYCDSYLEKNELDKYTIKNNNIPNLVSYVCILYGKNIKQKDIYNFDIMYALGMIKSEIIKRLTNESYNIKFPLWSPFHKLYNGAFVGSSLDGKTNCSYGRYEDKMKTETATKIISAAGDCILDATNRWKIPYSNNNINRINIKLELLDPKSRWKRYRAKKVKQYFSMDGNQGIYLKLNSGKSATYLPVVAKDNNHWSIDKYMESLSEKAGGNKDDWKFGTIWIYSSKSYTWDVNKKSIIS